VRCDRAASLTSWPAFCSTVQPQQKLGESTSMWYRELAILDAGHLLSLGTGALALTYISFMAGVDGTAAKAMRFIACAVTGIVVLASP
jgi:hypothetical protein